MRWAPRLDANQTAIVEALRAIGASVVSLAAVGNGCPDLLVGYRGRNFLLEVKNGRKPPSARRLTDAEFAFSRRWGGQRATVTSREEAFAAIGASVAPQARPATEATQEIRELYGRP